MQTIEPEYASALHHSGFNPYRQYCTADGPTLRWVVTALTDEAADKVILPLEDPALDCVTLKAPGMSMPVTEKIREEADIDALVREFYQAPAPERATLFFLTPTAFKKGGNYINYPDPRLVFQSLQMRYSELVDGDPEPDDDLIEELASHARVSSYNLKSTVFPLGKAKVASFQGRMTLQLTGPASLASFANLLVRFGGYSGVGIKTSMGMGAIRVGEPRKDEEDAIA